MVKQMSSSKTFGKTKWYFPKEKFEVRDIRDTNRFVLDDKFLNGYARFVGVYASAVYMSLCRHANKDQKCWPSIETIMKEIDIGKNKIIESIKYLEFWKIIRKERVGKQCTNRYFLLDKKQWKPISEVYLKDFSKVYGINFRGLRDKLQEFTTGTSNSKETQKKGNTIERKGLERFKLAKDILKDKQ